MKTMVRYGAIMVLLIGVIGLALGTVFIINGVSVNGMIAEQMQIEKATYDGMEGVIDTAEEAKLMSDTLKEHRLDMGIYTELDRNDPQRETILKAMTMENALNLAQLGFGVSTIVIGTGVFMLITGIALGGTGLGLYRLSGRES